MPKIEIDQPMSPECYPMSVLPHTSRLFTDYLAMGEASGAGRVSPVQDFYAPELSSYNPELSSQPPIYGQPTSAPESSPANGWIGRTPDASDPNALADALTTQLQDFGAGPQALANVERLRSGARAVVTGQQVGLFGGPLLTLLKAATAVARAAEAEQATGVPHVPIFWLASEDHDLEEVNQISLPARRELKTLRLQLGSAQGPVGAIPLGESVEAALDEACDLLGYAPVTELLRRCYTPDATLAGAFARWMTALFAAHGLVVIDAAARAFHTLGASVLRAAITDAEPLEQALLRRSAELEARGFPPQVLVKPGSSTLFLLNASTGERQPLKRSSPDTWKAGAATYTTAALLALVETEPERLSPNALLRPVFQDRILPTVAYIGGPAEIAYFAQTAVLYGSILGRVTPILPRFSATLVEPAIATVLARSELNLGNILAARTADALTQLLGARAMPIEGKRKLAAAGNAMDTELIALQTYMSSLDESLGRTAAVSGSKMRYQMNRLRRLAANFEVQKEASLRKHAEALMLHLLPEGRPQERVLGGVWFLAQGGEGMVDRLVAEAGTMCRGHVLVRM